MVDGQRNRGRVQAEERQRKRVLADKKILGGDRNTSSDGTVRWAVRVTLPPLHPRHLVFAFHKIARMNIIFLQDLIQTTVLFHQ